MQSPELARVLIVDDETSVLKLLKSMLGRANYKVETVSTAAQALDSLSKDVYDCVITDAVMPESSGYDLVRNLRSQPGFAELPILMLTKRRNREDVKLAVEAGVTDYVLKPIDEHLLLDKVGLCIKKNGKRHVFETTIVGPDRKAQIELSCELVSISESECTLRLPFSLNPRQTFRLESSVFKDIGLENPLLKVLECRAIDTDSPDARDFPYIAQLTFVGLPESDMRKIRMWTQREEIRRKK